ncbi:MAG: Ig-like domain-containing protein [Oscillospiraceae bacterium]|nr:Ig-like domain-containing protein [Oscillospiraceae bacterium]
MRKKLLAIILALVMLMSLVSVATSAYDEPEQLIQATASADSHVDTTIYISTDRIVIGDDHTFYGMGFQWDPSDIFDYTDEQWANFIRIADFNSPNIMRVMLHDVDSYALGFVDFDPEIHPAHYEQRYRVGTNTGTVTRIPVYDWDSVLMQRLYKILDFAEERGIPIMLGEWASAHDRGLLWFDHLGRTLSWQNPLWHVMIVDKLEHLIGERGYTVIRYYNMINEPNYNRQNPQNTRENWADGIVSLRGLMDESPVEGVRNVGIAGPDVFAGWDAWLDTSLSIHETHAHYEIHWYATGDAVRSGMVEQTMREFRERVFNEDPLGRYKGLGMGELGMSDGRTNGDQQLRTREFCYGIDMFDYAVQLMRAGSKYGIAWSFEDSMHVQMDDIINNGQFRPGNSNQLRDIYAWFNDPANADAYRVHTPSGDLGIDNNVKIWGFWNELAEVMWEQNGGVVRNNVLPTDQNLRPWYYTWSMVSRYFPAGSYIVEASISGIDGVRATTALVNSQDNVHDISIALVNNSFEDRVVELVVPNADELADLNKFFYFDGLIGGQPRPVNELGELLVFDTLTDVNLAEGFTVEIPAQTAMVFTTLGRDMESNPIAFATGREPAPANVVVESLSGTSIGFMGMDTRFRALVFPLGASQEVTWEVGDFFGNPLPEGSATIDANGVLISERPGTFRVTARSAVDPTLSGFFHVTMAVMISPLIDELQDITSTSTVGRYVNLSYDSTPANFGGRPTLNNGGADGHVTYTVRNALNFEIRSWVRNSTATGQGAALWNRMTEVYGSVDGNTWTRVIAPGTQQQVPGVGGWRLVTYRPADVEAFVAQGFNFIRVYQRALGGTVPTYEPQYGGATIWFDATFDGVTGVNVAQSRFIAAVGDTINFTANVEKTGDPATGVSWQVLEMDGSPTTRASITTSDTGAATITANQPGTVLVMATSLDDPTIQGFAQVAIGSTYFVDNIEDFTRMFSFDDFVINRGNLDEVNDPNKIQRVNPGPQGITYSLPGITGFSADVYMSGAGVVLDILTSSNGARFTSLGARSIRSMDQSLAVGAAWETHLVTNVLPIPEGTNFIRLVVDSPEMHRPRIGKVEIVFDENAPNDLLGLNINPPSPLVMQGETLQFTAGKAPATSPAVINWSTSNSDIATVNENGLLTAVAVGSVRVTAREQGGTISASTIVTVTPIDYARGRSGPAPMLRIWLPNEGGNHTGAPQGTGNGQWPNDTRIALTDGDHNTRLERHWQGGQNTGTINRQRFVLDMQDPVTGITPYYDTVRIFWEGGGYPRDFDVESINVNPGNATTKAEFTTHAEIRGKATGLGNHWDTITFDEPTNNRWLALYMIVVGSGQNHGGWGGYSMWALEVHNNAGVVYICGCLHVDRVIIQQPTCTVEGKWEDRCRDCDELHGHGIAGVIDCVPGERITVLYPTYTEPGRWEQVCTICGELYATGEIDALGRPTTEFTGTNPNHVKALLQDGDAIIQTRSNLGIFVQHSPFIVPAGRTLYVETTLNIQRDAELVIKGTVVVLPGGRINNQGSPNGGGTITIAEGGTLLNDGWVENVSNSAMSNYGMITNNGRFEVRTGVAFLRGDVAGSTPINDRTR